MFSRVLLLCEKGIEVQREGKMEPVGLPIGGRDVNDCSSLPALLLTSTTRLPRVRVVSKFGTDRTD